MTIDKEYVKGVLNQYADVAMAVSTVKQEIINERDINNDDKFSWREQDTIKTFLNFGITRLLDEYIPKGQH
jgi:hypothetical protein